MLTPAALHLAVTALVLSSSLYAADSQATELVEQGHFKQAKTVLSAYLKQNPGDAPAHCEMSKVAIAYGQFDEAIQQAETAVNSDQKNGRFHAQLAGALGAKLTSNTLGFMEKSSIAERFKKEAEVAIQLDPQNADAANYLAQFYIAAPAVAGGSKEKATQVADQMTKINPVHGYLIAAKLAAAEKNSVEQEKLLKRAAQAGPENYEAQVTLADFYVVTKNLSQAEDYARKALKIDPNRIKAYSLLAMVYTQQSEWSRLDTLLSESEHKVPDDLSPFFQSGRLIGAGNNKDQLPRAEKYLRKYLAQEPEPRQPQWSRAHWRLGQILEKAGNREEAKKEYSASLQLEPGLAEASQDLKRLQ